MRYLGRCKEIIASLGKLDGCKKIIPARGLALDKQAVVTFNRRLEALFDNYAYTSSAVWHAQISNRKITDKPTMPFAEEIDMTEN